MYGESKNANSCQTASMQNNDAFILEIISEFIGNVDRYEKLVAGLTEANYRLCPNHVPQEESISKSPDKEEPQSGSLQTLRILCRRFRGLNNEMDYQMANLNHKI